jgi:branched-chain amino acid transport system substrate-binding protein
VLKTGLAWTACAIAAPLPIRARGEQPVKIGMVEPLTGVYAALAEGEIAGARLAIEEINRSGGILGRETQLMVADSANDVMTGVAKTRELIDRDQVDFIAGNVNSAVALAMTQVTAEKRKLQIVTGGHTDEITDSRCSWNVFRICKSTTMEANAIADTLIEKLVVFSDARLCLWPGAAVGVRTQASPAWRRLGRRYSPARECRLFPGSDQRRGLPPECADQPHGRGRSGQQPHADR